MPLSLRLFPARAWPKWAALALTAIGAAGCSADATRLGQNPFASNYGAREAVGSGEVTGSVPPGQTGPIVRTETLPAPPPPRLGANAPQESGTAGGGRGLASYRPPAAPDFTGSVSPAVLRTAAPARPASNGGTSVTVATGDTIEGLSHKYGVTAAAIRQANGLKTLSVLRVGQRLIIPRRTRPLVAAAIPRPGPSAAGAAGGQVHVVAPGETLIKIAKHYHQPLIELARANRILPHTKVKLGDRLVIPGARAQGQAQTAPPPPAPPAAAKGKLAESEPAQGILIMKEGPDAQRTEISGNLGDRTGSLPSFRWPVHAKIIAPFGPMSDGQQNDGINLAVPEGTPIKAAEDGVVAYAGNAVRRYGNLLLVRHANGYSTAYAYLSELMVKRDDLVKRGQVIARAGQSGGASSPQLHFQVRKGNRPVDPVPLLDRGG